MKTRFTIKFQLALLAAFLCCTFVAYSYSPQLDVNNPTYNYSVASTNHWQSFTAGITGCLREIDVYKVSRGDYSFTLNIYSGAGINSSNLMWTRNYNFGNGNANSWQPINLPQSNPPQLTAGNMYTFQIVTTSNISFGIQTPNGLYSGGSYKGTSADLGFKTYVLNHCCSNPPVAVCNSIGITLGPDGTYTLTQADINAIGAGSSSDCYGGAITLSVSPNTFNCNNVGQYVPVVLTVTDVAGHTSTCSTTVAVHNDIILTDASCPEQIIAYTGPSAVTCSTSVDLQTYAPFSSCGSQLISGFGLMDFPVGTTQVYLTIYDEFGVAHTCATPTDIIVYDNTPPVANCQNYTVYLDANGNASITPANIDNGSYDNCGIDYSLMSVSPNTFNCTNVGPNQVTLTVWDIHGNSSTCTATVNVVDNTYPTAICKNATVYLDAFGNAGITAADINNGSYDNCGIANTSVYPNTFNCSNLGANQVTLTVTDVNGLAGTCTATVTVVDNTAPQFTSCPSNINATANAQTCSTAVTWTTPTVSDNCTATLIPDPTWTSGSTFPIGTTTVTYNVVDEVGNSGTPCTFTVTVSDPNANTAPTITLSPNSLWSPDHKLATITATLISNNCCNDYSITNLNITESDQGNGCGSPNNTDIVINPNNYYSFQLAAERCGQGDGRVYNCTFSIHNNCYNNDFTVTGYVYITHDQGQQAKAVFQPTNTTVQGFDIDNIYPNPFQPPTTISYTMPEAGNASMIIYNSVGEVVKVLFNQSVTAGNHNILWDGTNDKGQQVGSGVYYATFTSGTNTKTVMLNLIK